MDANQWFYTCVWFEALSHFYMEGMHAYRVNLIDDKRRFFKTQEEAMKHFSHTRSEGDERPRAIFATLKVDVSTYKRMGQNLDNGFYLDTPLIDRAHVDWTQVRLSNFV